MNLRKVWEKVITGDVEAGKSWCKATIRIDGQESNQRWSATAIAADGKSPCGKTFWFE